MTLQKTDLPQGNSQLEIAPTLHCNVYQVLLPCLLLNNVRAIHYLSGRVITKCIPLYFYNNMLSIFILFSLHSFFLVTLLSICIDTASEDISQEGSYCFRSHNKYWIIVCQKKVVSKILTFISLDFNGQNVLLPDVLLILLIWSCILVTHTFQLCFFLLSEMFPFCWQRILILKMVPFT